MLSLSLPLPLVPGLFRTVAGIGFKVHLVFFYYQWEKSNAPPCPTPGSSLWGHLPWVLCGLTLAGGAAGDERPPGDIGLGSGVPRVSPGLVPLLSHSGSLWCPWAHGEARGHRGQGGCRTPRAGGEPERAEQEWERAMRSLPRHTVGREAGIGIGIHEVGAGVGPGAPGTGMGGRVPGGAGSRGGAGAVPVPVPAVSARLRPAAAHRAPLRAGCGTRRWRRWGLPAR